LEKSILERRCRKHQNTSAKYEEFSLMVKKAQLCIYNSGHGETVTVTRSGANDNNNQKQGRCVEASARAVALYKTKAQRTG